MAFKALFQKIEKFAREGNLYAIGLLNECACDNNILLALASQKQNKNAALNASLVLLQKKDPNCIEQIIDLLLTTDPSVVITEFPSPAMTLSAKKLAYKGSARSQENFSLEQMTTMIRQKILSDCTELPQNGFLEIAEAIVEANQNDLIPTVINHLIMMKHRGPKSSSKSGNKKWDLLMCVLGVTLLF